MNYGMCGRWRNGRLSSVCTMAGSEECDFECPHRDDGWGDDEPRVVACRCPAACPVHDKPAPAPGVMACPKGKGICGDVAPDKRCFTCPVPDQSIQDLRTDATQESDDFKAAVLRCRYPVCKTIHPSGWGWDTSRLNEVIADHAGVTTPLEGLDG